MCVRTVFETDVESTDVRVSPKGILCDVWYNAT